jgi:hypothetical protein
LGIVRIQRPAETLELPHDLVSQPRAGELGLDRAVEADVQRYPVGPDSDEQDVTFSRAVDGGGAQIQGCGGAGGGICRGDEHRHRRSVRARGAPLTAVAGHLGDTVETASRIHVHSLRDDRDIPAQALDRILSPCHGCVTRSPERATELFRPRSGRISDGEPACKPDSVGRSLAGPPRWPSICAAYLGTSAGPAVPRLALLRVGVA